MDQARKDVSCEEVYSMNITGRGVGVAVLDAGTYLHEDFKNRVATFADFVNHRTSPYNDSGHGAHIAAMIEGSGISSDGKYRGMAPGCSLISVKVLDQKGNGYATDVPTGLKWIRENRGRYNIRTVNISVDSLSRRDMTGNSILVRGVDAAWDDGLVMVVAAGSHGPGQTTIATPSISRKVIIVGCPDDHEEVDVMGSRMVDYSGGGPALACICKPDLVTPGSSIISCCSELSKYFLKSGTNISTLLVSGAIALLLEKYPGIGNKDVRLRIRERTLDLDLPHSQQGWGKPDVGQLPKRRYTSKGVRSNTGEPLKTVLQRTHRPMLL